LIGGAIALLPLLGTGLQKLPDLAGDRANIRDLLVHQSDGLLNPGQSTAPRKGPALLTGFRYALLHRPFGAGIGSTSVATKKFGTVAEGSAEFDATTVA